MTQQQIEVKVSLDTLKLALEAFESDHVFVWPNMQRPERIEVKRNEAITALRQAIAAAEQHKQAQKDHTYGYAKQLAEAIFKLHFASDEHYASGRIVWGVNDTVIGILTQIDNMVADMVRKPEQAQKQEPVSFITPLMEQQLFDDWCPYKGNPDLRTAWTAAIDAVNGLLLGVSPPQRQPLTDEQERKVARLFSDRVAEMCNVDADDHWKYHFDGVLADVQFVLKAAHGITGEQK